MKRIPHPSITGLTSLAVIGSWLNSKSGWTAKTPGKDSVSNWLLKGDVQKATSRFAENLKSTLTNSSGRKALVTSALVATGGAVARKWFPNTKIGTDRLYLRL